MATTCSATLETVVIECPDFADGICHQKGCPRFLCRVSKQGIDDEGNQLYGGACILNGETEWFDDCLPYQEDVPSQQISDDTNNDAPRKVRHRGRSIFDGQRVHQDIESDSQKQFIKVNNRNFELTRPIDWAVADRMLRAVRDRESDYVIDLTTSECNALSQEGKAFVKYCLERQPLAKPIRGKKYTGKARIKHDLLRANQI